MSYKKRQELVKKSQELYSWDWFYLNSESNLQVSRYLKASKLITDKVTGEFKRISIIPYLDFSQRFKEDRAAAFKIGLEIRANQEKLNNLNKNKK